MQQAKLNEIERKSEQIKRLFTVLRSPKLTLIENISMFMTEYAKAVAPLTADETKKLVDDLFMGHHGELKGYVPSIDHFYRLVRAILSRRESANNLTKSREEQLELAIKQYGKIVLEDVCPFEYNKLVADGLLTREDYYHYGLKTIHSHSADLDAINDYVLDNFSWRQLEGRKLTPDEVISKLRQVNRNCKSLFRVNSYGKA
ncbi:hypothetical protein [Bartonella sp. DGB1]|uniref:hypothetical protein n=1 Tax=Bartonella sp. DGB1 TaxID=3239807 RepID=UPI0035251B83